MSNSEWSESSEHAQDPRVRKRRKIVEWARSAKTSGDNPTQVSMALARGLFDALLDAVTVANDPSVGSHSFEEFVEPLLPDLIDASAAAQVARIRTDGNGRQIIPLSRLQSKAIADQITPSQSTTHALIRRRLALHPDSLRTSILNAGTCFSLSHDASPTPLHPYRSNPANPQAIESLYAIRTTPYESSFASRLQGFPAANEERILSVDWGNRTSWMDLMQDIREHFSLMHPERDQSIDVQAPIVYGTLQQQHIDQVHDLLWRTFWTGIDVSDALQDSPERCTAIAAYKRLVVGVALLSSPQESYITYLAVKPGWDNAQIATTMLYHLITLNPHRDITLHVSIKNPAMLLYNRFGFKAEEFVVGFYEDYLDSQSRVSKNAFRLRLRQS